MSPAVMIDIIPSESLVWHVLLKFTYVRLCPTQKQALGQSVVVLTRDWRKIPNDRIGAMFDRFASPLIRTEGGPIRHCV